MKWFGMDYSESACEYHNKTLLSLTSVTLCFIIFLWNHLYNNKIESQFTENAKQLYCTLYIDIFKIGGQFSLYCKVPTVHVHMYVHISFTRVIWLTLKLVTLTMNSKLFAIRTLSLN